MTLFQLAGGLVLLYFGAEWLVRGASALGVRLGLTPLVIGLTIVAFGTSAPELAVSIQAGLDGQGDLALGNVIGSNIANIALILGVAAMVRPLSVHAQVIRIEAPLVIVASLLLCGLLFNGVLGRVEGAILFLGLVCYVVYSVRAARAETSAVVADEFAEFVRAPTRPSWQFVALIVAGLVILVVGAGLLVTGAGGIARSLGVAEALIGLTIVAMGTSLPELATSTVASYRREGDIAVGNALGSNLFNILCVLGLAAFVIPLGVGNVSWVDLGVMVAVALVALPILRSGFVISRLEGAMLVGSYLAYITWLVINA